SPVDTRAGERRDRRWRGRGVPRRRQEDDGCRSGGRVRAARPRDVRADGANRDHPALGALLRLRRRPDAAFPAGTGRAEPVLTAGAAELAVPAPPEPRKSGRMAWAADSLES